MTSLRSGALYFGWVFAAGIVLGIVRVRWLAPRLGLRAAELVELPVMLLLSAWAARWTVRRHRLTGLGSRLAAGAVALALLAAAEVAVVRWGRGLTLGEYVRSRDPVAGGAYLAALGVFALLPALAGPRERRR